MQKLIHLKSLGTYTIEIGEYLSNGNTSVVLYCLEFPLEYIKLSLNSGIKLPNGEFIVKNYSENAGIPEQVFKSNLFEDTGRTHTLPHGIVCPIWRIKS